MPTINPESNLFGLDYRAEAARLGPPPAPMIDAHTHINGGRCAEVYARAREVFGVVRTWSMTALDLLDPVRKSLGDSVSFIAVPRFSDPDRKHAFTQGFLDDLTHWSREGVRVCKFWTAPRGRDIGRTVGDASLVTFDSPWRRRHMERAAELGMMFMAHVADPDTWFKTKYADASVYGTKASHYEPVEKLLDEFRLPWLLAHMGGWPEDLGFLTGLLSRHDNLFLDTSATKWMVRELSKHPREEVVGFVSRFKDRLLFGSDIVALDDHVQTAKSSAFAGGDKSRQASSDAEAFDLYASRYWALRTLWETGFDGPSPIADGDLKMVDPDRHTDESSPRLCGKALPADLLRALYHDNATRVLDGWAGKRA